MKPIKPFLSIVIPVYNVELYIEACLKSVLSQSFNDYELLLIDDGSTDNSGEICDYYAKADSRVLVIHQDNRGVSSARNKGISIAKGDWIYFVDSDDNLSPNCLNLLVSNIRPDVDIVEGRYLPVRDGLVKNMPSFSQSKEFYNRKDYLYRLYKYRPRQYHGYLWNKIFRMSVIRNADMRFNESIYFKEDGLFIMDYICNMNHGVLYLHCLLYIYYKRNSGMMETYLNKISIKSISHLRAVILMYESMKDLNPSFKTKCAAKDEICRSYRLLSRKIDDDKLRRNLKDLFDKSISSEYYCGYKFRQWLHSFRVKKKISVLKKRLCFDTKIITLN